MAKPRKKKSGDEQAQEADRFSPFPTAYSPSGIYPMTPPIWPNPGLGYDLQGMTDPEDRDWQDI